MNNRRWTHLISAPRQFKGIGFGVCIGIFLGVCLQFESHSDVEQKLIAQQFNQAPNSNKTLATKDIWIRCVILIQPDDPRPHKYLRSILDTYAKRCNKTIFFTKEEKLLPKFHGNPYIFAFSLI